MQKRSFFPSFLHGWWLCTGLCVGATSLCQDAWYRYAHVSNRKAEIHPDTSIILFPFPASVLSVVEEWVRSWGTIYYWGVCDWQLYRRCAGMGSGLVMEDQALVAWPFFLPATLVTKGLVGILSWYVGVLSLHLMWNLKTKFQGQCPYQYSECWYSELICFLLILSYSASRTEFASYLKHRGDNKHSFKSLFWIWPLFQMYVSVDLPPPRWLF